MTKKTISLIVGLLVLFLTTQAQYAEITKLLADGGQALDEFGYTVGIDGNYAIVGTPNDNENGDDAGAVFIYKKDEGGNNNWGLIKKIIATDGQAGDKFGYSVSIYGEYAIVGSPYHNNNGYTDAGAVYFIKKDEGGVDNWGEIKINMSSNHYDHLGKSVSMYGDYAVVGIPDANGYDVDEGKVYVYSKDEGGVDNWGYYKLLDISPYNLDEYDNFGSSVSISENTIVVGVPGYDINSNANDGAVFIFHRHEDGMNNWGMQKYLYTVGTNANFGSSVGTYGDYVIIGVENKDVAYIHYKNQGGTNNWGEQKELTPGEQYDFFGSSVFLSNDYAAVGAYNDDGKGSFYIFNKNEGGNNNWGEVGNYFASDGNSDDYFGCSIAMSDDNIIIGANGVDDNGSLSGATYIFGSPQAPSISIQPENQLDACLNTNIVFSIQANNVDTYQWNESTDGGSNWTIISDNDTYLGSNTNLLTVSISSELNNYQYSCTLTNTIGSITSDIATLTIENNPPVINSIHNDITIDADADCQTILPDYTIEVSAEDDCDTELDITQMPVEGTIISGYTNTVTLTVTDNVGNYTEVTFNVEVEDVTDPEVICIEDVIKTANETHFYTISGTEFDPLLVDDNCIIASISNNVNQTETLAGEQFAEGEHTIYWTVQDNSGNTNYCSFNLTVDIYSNIYNLLNNGISIYPNPTNGIINIEFADNNIQQIIISDITGKTIAEKNNIQQNKTIDLSNFESGIYIIKIQTDNEIFTTKIVKE